MTIDIPIWLILLFSVLITLNTAVRYKTEELRRQNNDLQQGILERTKELLEQFTAKKEN